MGPRPDCTLQNLAALISASMDDTPSAMRLQCTDLCTPHGRNNG
jgi:hypothetical protein